MNNNLNHASPWPAHSKAFTEQVGIDHPIIQAPMAGGPTTPELIAAVSNAGGLGSMGAGYLPAQQVEEAILAVRRLTASPFAVNLFIPSKQEPEPPAPQVLNKLARYAAELGIEAPSPEYLPGSNFDEQFEVALETGVPVFSFTFGLLPSDRIRALKARGIYVMGTATCLSEALALEEHGCDAVVAQGSEAGGHRGSFSDHSSPPLLGGLALIPLLADRLKIPVVASGGIMDGRGIVAAMALGAAAVQMGTAFLSCDEAGVHPAWREALQSNSETSTDLIKTFSGKPARGIVNRFSREMAELEDQVAAYPIQNHLTKTIRAAAKAQNRPEFMSLWAGQGLVLSRSLPAAELMQTLATESAEIIAGFTSTGDR